MLVALCVLLLISAAAAAAAPPPPGAGGPAAVLRGEEPYVFPQPHGGPKLWGPAAALFQVCEQAVVKSGAAPGTKKNGGIEMQTHNLFFQRLFLDYVATPSPINNELTLIPQQPHCIHSETSVSTPNLSYKLKHVTMEGSLEYISTKNVQKESGKIQLLDILVPAMASLRFRG